MGDRDDLLRARRRVLDRERSVLVVIDLQDGYRGKLHEEERTIGAAQRLLRAAEILGVPVLACEQYPKGVGPTRVEIASCLPSGTLRFEKTSFSALGAPGFQDALDQLGRDQVVVTGIETHVCVAQTVHELLATGRDVHAVRDAITARFPLEDEIGWAKLIGAGAVPASSEGALFEWLRDARAPEFKAVRALVA